MKSIDRRARVAVAAGAVACALACAAVAALAPRPQPTSAPGAAEAAAPEGEPTDGVRAVRDSYGPAQEEADRALSVGTWSSADGLRSVRFSNGTLTTTRPSEAGYAVAWAGEWGRAEGESGGYETREVGVRTADGETHVVAMTIHEPRGELTITTDLASGRSEELSLDGAEEPSRAVDPSADVEVAPGERVSADGLTLTPTVAARVRVHDLATGVRSWAARGGWEEGVPLPAATVFAFAEGDGARQYAVAFERTLSRALVSVRTAPDGSSSVRAYALADSDADSLKAGRTVPERDAGRAPASAYGEVAR